MKSQYRKEPFSALEAITEAQKIAFAPILFQAVWALRELGIFAELDNAEPDGLTVQELSSRLDLSEYGVGVLIDMALSGKIVWQDNDRFHLGKTGYFLLNDKMTQINMNFAQHVCYQPMVYLMDSIKNGKPEGLKVLGEWDSIYPALSNLPEPARSSWFEFDHFYSDQAFVEALPTVFEANPEMIFDIGGNTGKGARCFLENSPTANVKILDLPEQIRLAKEGSLVKDTDRLSFHEINVLDTDEFPPGADVYWMSQFLDCFSESEITQILSAIRKGMKPGARIIILELFWDRQIFEGAAFSLNAISLYFTCLANGNSRFYRSKDMISCIEKAGLSVTKDIDGLGLGHSLLECIAA